MAEELKTPEDPQVDPEQGVPATRELSDAAKAAYAADPTAPKPKEDEEPKKGEGEGEEPKPEGEEPKPEGEEPKPEGEGDESPGELKLDEGDPTPAEGTLDLEGLQTEFFRDGDLSEASRKAVSEQLFHPDANPKVVKQYIDGYLENLRISVGTYEAAQSEARFVHAGGKETYTKVQAWANENLPVEERVAYNKAATGEDPATAKLAIEGITAKYLAATSGSAPETDLSHRSTGSASGIPAIRGPKDLQKLIASPEYKTSQDFRDGVAARLKQASASGQYRFGGQA